MKKLPKPLSLHRETLRQLDQHAMAAAAGGATNNTICHCNPTFVTCTCTDEVTSCGSC
jgi:hypothetical protein